MFVYLRGKLIVVETNVPYALGYWTERRRTNPHISWKLATV